MLNGVKSVAYYTALGAATGAAIGAGVGLVSVSTICVRDALQGFFLDQLFDGPSLSKLDRRLDMFQNCQKVLSIGAVASFGLAGATIGLIYGVSKEVLKNYEIQIKYPMLFQRMNVAQ